MTNLSLPRILLHAEGGAVMLAAIIAYVYSGSGWWPFAILFLAPDLSMIGYLAGPRIGAVLYNCFHTYLAPLALIGFGTALSSTLAVSIGLIWIAHIGLDRLLGFGLKCASGFKDTHLSRS